MTIRSEESAQYKWLSYISVYRIQVRLEKEKPSKYLWTFDTYSGGGL